GPRRTRPARTLRRGRCRWRRASSRRARRPTRDGARWRPPAGLFLRPDRRVSLVEDHDRPDLDAAVRRRGQLPDGQRVVEVVRLDEVEAAERLFGFYERTVRDYVAADR